jgi:exodeoxyribonuclease VII large subunit
MPDFPEFMEELARLKRGRKAPASGEAPAALSVSELTQRIEGAIRAGVPQQVLVRGEVSNFKLHSGSGHLYFTLKDSGACIDCVTFRSDAGRLRFLPEDGMEVVATGRVAVYAQRGRYQLYVSALEPIGAGALEAMFRQLCQRLEAEGLFATERKKPIPPYPATIALVTGRATAALQDMLKVLRRFPWLRLIVCDVPVQGAQAAPAIAAALQLLSREGARLGVEVILLARGGGSLEDLWAFNEEPVARAMAACPIPIVTGIGHEVDVSVADLVADYHAHTPTEAAQVISAQWRQAGEQLNASSLRLARALRGLLHDSRQRLAAVAGHEFFRRPKQGIDRARQRLDDLEEGLSRGATDRVAAGEERLERLDRNLERAGRARVTRASSKLASLELRLRQRDPRHLRVLFRERLGALETRLRQALRVRLDREARQVEQVARQLEALGPQQVLQRGYSITMLKKRGEIVRQASQIKGGERLLTRLADGTVESIAEDPRQPTLF